LLVEIAFLPVSLYAFCAHFNPSTHTDTAHLLAKCACNVNNDQKPKQT